ncbi:hypothetical protein LT104_10205 [Lacticaseibacillus zeae]|uniref:hypothetical protein n=1 Tax=Lacticaseibacillus zeae TaxID=57037 RepID=UPI00237F5DB6|nr:hypothetical protein [Lacticaseibacillus zeae]MDE3316271.1 hypothetical protein [Lacticaseibacillus zeae]
MLKFVFNFFTQTGDEVVEVVTGGKWAGAGTSLYVKSLSAMAKARAITPEATGFLCCSLKRVHWARNLRVRTLDAMA